MHVAPVPERPHQRRRPHLTVHRQLTRSSLIPTDRSIGTETWGRDTRDSAASIPAATLNAAEPKQMADADSALTGLCGIHGTRTNVVQQHVHGRLADQEFHVSMELPKRRLTISLTQRSHFLTFARRWVGVWQPAVTGSADSLIGGPSCPTPPVSSFPSSKFVDQRCFAAIAEVAAAQAAHAHGLGVWERIPQRRRESGCDACLV